MASSANMLVQLTVEDAASQAIRNMSGELEKANAKLEQSAKHADRGSAMFGKFGLAIAGVAAIGAAKFIGFMGDAIDKGSALNESVSKSGVVFGQYANEIEAWSKTASSSFGMTQQAALEAAGTYGNLFQAFGIGQESAKTMSTTLVELAADLASFNNTSIDDAILALRSGLSGETEPLKKYGIALTDARLKTEAMTLGIYDGKGALDAAQKSQAAYALVMKDSALAQGDFDRTADGFANTMRTIEAAVGDAQAEIGVALVGAIQDATKAMGGTGGLTDGLKGASDYLADLITGAGAMSVELGKLNEATKTSADSSGLLGNMWNTTWKIWENTPFGAPVQGLNMLRDAGNDAGEAAKKSSDEFSGYSAAIAAYSPEAQKAAAKSRELAGATKEVGTTAEQAQAALLKLLDAADKVTGKTRSAIEAESGFERSLDELAKTFKGKLDPAVANNQRAFDLHRESGRKAAEALNGIATAAYDAAKAAGDEGKWEKANRILERGRSAIERQAREWGLSKDAAKRYADTILAIPTEVQTNVRIKYFGGTPTNTAGYVQKAGGGLISGPGTGTSDSIAARLSNGEFVVKASAVERVGVGFLDALNRGAVPGFAIGGLAGIVTSAAKKVTASTPSASSVTSIAMTVASTVNNVAAQIAADAAAERQRLIDLASANFLAQREWAAQQAELARAQAQQEADLASLRAQQLADVMEANAKAAADAAAESARASIAATEAIKAIHQKLVDGARGFVESAVQVRNDWARSVSGSSIAFGGISGFDPTAGATGGGGMSWADATLRAPGSVGAGNDGGFGATGSSAPSVTAWLRTKLDRVREFGDVIRRLTSAGLNHMTLQEIVSAGPDQGTTLGKALLDAGAIAEVNSIQGQLVDVAGGIGASTANTLYAASIAAAQADYTQVVARSPYADTTPLQVNLMLDGNVVVTTLLGIKRNRGGAELGIA